jgi:hypothetical protein
MEFNIVRAPCSSTTKDITEFIDDPMKEKVGE